MPINAITAPFYAIVHYTTAAKPSGHTLRLYLDAIPTYNATNTLFPTYVDAGQPAGWTLKLIVANMLNRMIIGSANAEIVVNEVEMWQSVPAAPNLFIGLDPDDYSAVLYGAGNGVASAYTMWVFKAANRAQMRFSLFEANTSSPQRFPLASPPAIDNTSLAWLIIRSAIGFVTNDNLPLTVAASMNTGYNRKLARSYGRVIAP